MEANRERTKGTIKYLPATMSKEAMIDHVKAEMKEGEEFEYHFNAEKQQWLYVIWSPDES